MKRALSIVLLLSMIFCLFGCDRSIEAGGGEPITDYDGVYIIVEGTENVGGTGALIVRWVNESEYMIGYGLGYDIEYLLGDKWVSARITDFAIPEIWCMIDPGESGTQHYRTQYFNMLLPGRYRVAVEFYVYDRPESTTAGRSYAEFTVK